MIENQPIVISYLTKKFTEVNDSTKKLGDVFEKPKLENKTPNEFAVENAQPATENFHNQTHGGVLCEPSPEHTVLTMKTANNNFGIEERPNGDIFWIGKLVEKLGGSRFQIGKDE